MHIAGFGATHWSSLNRIVRTVFLEIEYQNKTWGQTEGQKDRQKEGADDRDFRNYSMMKTQMSISENLHIGNQIWHSTNAIHTQGKAEHKKYILFYLPLRMLATCHFVS